MGNIIKWRIPDLNEVSYDKAYIYRADSQNGTYTEIANQDITDNTYFDPDGSTTNWYKVRFFDSINNIWSAYSEPIQGGTFIGYCTPDDVRNITNITSDDLSDSELYELIQMATAEINNTINTKVVRERITYLDSTRENSIDGSNKTYYVSKWKGHYFGDMNHDGKVDTDDIKVYVVDSNGNESEATVTSIDAENCKFELDTAYDSGNSIYVTYAYTSVSVDPPSNLIKFACALLTAAYAYSKINFGRAPNVAFGNVKIYRHMDAFDKYYSMYQRTIQRAMLSGPSSLGGDYSEADTF